MHLFGHRLDHDYYFELLREEERAAHSITRCSTAHHRLFRADPRANRTFCMFVIPSLAPHPVESNGQSPRLPYHSHLAASSHPLVDLLPAPTWQTPHWSLCR